METLQNRLFVCCLKCFLEMSQKFSVVCRMITQPGVLSCMPSERAAEVLGTMQAADTTKLLLSMKVTEIGEKSQMFADVVCGMKKEDMLDTVRCFMNSK